MRFKGLDLNLLVAFDALIATRSVSRAAERLNLSQPAMSASLSRLRDYFGDPLLVQHGKRMHPTAFADEMAPEIRQSLEQLETMLARSPNFDPATSRRSFRIVTSDYMLASIIVPLIRDLADEAPGIRIDCQLPQAFTAQQLDDGTVDLMISPEFSVSGRHPSYPLLREPQMVIGARDNPLLVGGEISEEDFLAADHVVVMLGETHSPAYADRQMDMMGKNRRIAGSAPSFMALPWMIEGTDRLALLHSSIVADMEARFDIIGVPPPFEIPPMLQMVSFHSGREDDAGLKWLRERLRQQVNMKT